jgi:hypothetical protein
LGVFLIFLLLSAMFWFLTQLEEVYVTSISYPVEYQDMPEDKIVVGNLPDRIDLEIRGQGFQLLEYKFIHALTPLVLHLDAFNLHSSEQPDTPRHFIVTQAATPRIAQQLNQEIEILNITPDTLFFEFAEKSTRRVPVQPNITYDFANQMMLKGEIRLEPDSINISGPGPVVDTTEVVATTKHSFDELNKTIQTSVRLKRTHHQVEFSQERVQLTIPVEQYTEGELQKQIVVENVPDSLVVRTFPQVVTITYLVGLSRYEQVIPELFKARVNYEDVEGGNQKLPVYIEQAPDYLKSYSYVPREVEYIIEKQE